MSVFYTSDLHLRDPASPAACRFTDFLGQVPRNGDVLVLGGDIFDLFVGDKAAFRRKFGAVLGAIRGLESRAVKVYYLEGNHDFHLGRALGEGAELRADDFGFSLPGYGRVWVSHGDLIDPEDRGYRLLRRATRSLPFRALLKGLPGALIDGIGSWSSRQSRKYNDGETIDDENQRRLRRLYLDYAREKVRQGYQHVLVGHSHIFDHVEIEEGALKGEYLNLGFSGAYLPFAELAPGAARFHVRRFPDR